MIYIFIYSHSYYRFTLMCIQKHMNTCEPTLLLALSHAHTSNQDILKLSGFYTNPFSFPTSHIWMLCQHPWHRFLAPWIPFSLVVAHVRLHSVVRKNKYAMSAEVGNNTYAPDSTFKIKLYNLLM